MIALISTIYVADMIFYSNLTNANHVIFASPLLTHTQQSYDALTKQSIGRVKRYGQRRTVQLYRFVALRTADVDILQEREPKLVVKQTVYKGKGARKNAIVKWMMVGEKEMDVSMEAGWGSGFDFKSNPAEDND